MPEPRLYPQEMLTVLIRHRVQFVLIGALAATLHGSPLRTNDADICPQHEDKNLMRLARALREMNARVYSVEEPQGLAFACDATMLANASIWNLITDYGRLDISYEPSGTRGYEDLAREAIEVDIGGGMHAKVASLLDVIRSKEAAGRTKDHDALPVLRAMLERQSEA